MEDARRFVHTLASGLNVDELDTLPFGAVLVDEQGKVLFFNTEEERQSERKRADVLGKNFFTEVAPCTQVKEFYEQFTRAVRSAGIIASFNFHFPVPPRGRAVHLLLASFRHQGELLCLIIISDIRPS